MEHLIKQIVKASRVHKFEITEDEEVIGDKELLRDDLSEPKLVRDELENVCVELEVKAPKEFSIKNIVDFLIEEAKLKKEISFSDDDEIDQDDRGPYVSYKGTGTKASFELKVENHKMRNDLHVFSLCYS